MVEISDREKSRTVQWMHRAIKTEAMDIIMQSLGFTAGESLENYIREKLEKFESWENIIRANIILYLGPDSKPDKNTCEIKLEVPGKDHFVKKSSDSFEKAITEAVNTIQHNPP
jgi:ribosome hibernation promoting factor